MHSSDYARALDLLQKAATEFPNDAELTELEKLAQDGLKRKTEAHRLMTEGQDLCAKQKPAEGIKLLREAYELDENNPLPRAVLANALVERARTVVETDWQEAEKLSRDALDLNPGHPMAKTIRTEILHQKRESFVEECVSQARKLQATSDLAGALSRIEEGLSIYPREPRLVQLQDVVQGDLQTQRRQSRRRDLEDLRNMESEIDTATEATAKQSLVDRVRAVVDKYPDDFEVVTIANGLLRRLGMLEATRNTVIEPRPKDVHANETATLTFHERGIDPTQPLETLTSSGPVAPPADATGAPPAPPAPTVAAPAPPSAARAKVPAPPPKPAAAKRAAPISNFKLPAKSQKFYATAILASVGAVALVTVFFLFGRKRPAPAVAPPVAEAPIASTQAPAPPPLPPEPPVPMLKLISDTGTGKVTFDDQPPAQFQDGQWTLEKLPAGDHKLKVVSPQGEVSFAFANEDGAAPSVKGAIASRGLLAVVVTGLADNLHVYSSDASIKLSLDGGAPVGVPRDGVELPAVPAGPHELAVTRGSDQYHYKLDPNAGTVPTLSTFLESGQDLGTLVVVTGQDKARVFLNGALQPRLTQSGGQLRIPNLELKEYVVRVSKSGFQELPDQRIRIRKGEQAKLTFSLQPIQRFSSLTIQGGVPGTAVLLDQTPVGTIQPDGMLTVATVNPGDHIVELRKDRFKPRQIKKTFVVGTAVSLAAADAALEVAPAELKITFTPADAQVTLGKAGETPAKVTSGSMMNLSGGSYTLTAKTADNFTRSSTVDVSAGQSKNLDLSLAPSGMSKWDDPASWKPENGAFVHKGGDFVMYNLTPTSGTFVFSAMLTKGKRLQWMLNCVDANNYVLFQMDENNFYRSVVRNGEKGDEVKIPHKGDKKSFRTLQIRVGLNEITHLIRQGDNWVVLERWTQPGSNFTLGRFGFYIPGNDQVALSSFGHYVDLNTR